MWRIEQSRLGGGAVRHRVLEGHRPLGAGEAIELWQGSVSFRALLIDALAEATPAAYFWELPPLSSVLVDRDFEYVITPSTVLASMPAEPEAFAEHFVAGEAVAAFVNLGGDACLVAPAALSDPAHYVHLACFSRVAPVSQQHLLWRRVGAEAERRLGERPLWISTCGTGVGWLHVRLDTRPKYYTHAPYRRYDGADEHR